MKLFTGNCPESVCKTAKYHIRRENGKFVVGINYNTGNGEYWTPTTELHPDLVEMVNNVKNEINSSPGGAFYINEFRQVIVPAEGKYFLAGKYEKSLQFSRQNDDGEVVVISGKAVDLQGNALNPGDEWYGYLMGIPYVLAAGGNDIRFEIKLNANHFRRIPLSKTTSVSAAKSLAQKLCRIVGHTQGGRFYINDEREMFKPEMRDGSLIYIYLGKLEESDPWFPHDLFEKTCLSE